MTQYKNYPNTCWDSNPYPQNIKKRWSNPLNQTNLIFLISYANYWNKKLEFKILKSHQIPRSLRFTPPASLTLALSLVRGKPLPRCYASAPSHSRGGATLVAVMWFQNFPQLYFPWWYEGIFIFLIFYFHFLKSFYDFNFVSKITPTQFHFSRTHVLHTGVLKIYLRTYVSYT